MCALVTGVQTCALPIFGFDWPDVNGPRDKIAEELAEVADAANEAERHEEVGDLLFAVVNYARKLGVDAESALRDANLKFAGRFAAMRSEERRGGKECVSTCRSRESPSH